MNDRAAITAVMVSLPDEISATIQGPALLALEKHLRLYTGLDVRVFKDLKGDDSVLRSIMTVKQRDKL